MFSLMQFGTVMVDSLFNAGVITSKEFGIFIGKNNTEQSQITIGANLSSDNLEGNPTYVSIVPVAPGTSYFSIAVTSIEFDGKTLNGTTNTFAILDPGSVVTYLPRESWEDWQYQVNANHDCGVTLIDGYKACLCSSVDEFKPIIVKMAGVNVTIKPSTFIKKRFVNNLDQCYFLIGRVEDTEYGATKTYKFGKSFFQSTYVSVNLKDSKVGFAEVINPPLVIGKKEAVIVTTSLVLLILALSCCCVCCLMVACFTTIYL